MQLSQDERNQCEDFLTAFNQIESHLRQILKEAEHKEFKRLLDQYLDNHATWRKDRQKIRNWADLRNVLTHQRTTPYQYPAVPSTFTLAEVKKFRDALINPQKAIPTFQREVEFLSPDKSLAWVLGKINDCDYSQFPVYEGQTFLGLLTENGITRWLAHHTSNETIVDFEDEKIRQILPEEEERSNYTFVSRETLVDEIVEEFSENLFLEAALITHNGRENEKLLGIATRWDILQQIQ
jgi:predicted transcriptional regulator